MVHPTDELYRIAADYVKPIRDSVLEAIRETLKTATEQSLYEALGKVGGFTKAVENVEELAEILGNKIAANVLPKMTDAWFAAGRRVSSVLPKGALLQPYIFDTSRVAALAADGGYRAGFVQEITREQQRVITQIINRGFVESLSRRQVARLLRDSVGLTAQQEKWVWNYRQQLRELDPDMFDRQLRDRRSDKRLQRLIEEGGALDAASIDKMTERYRQRLIQYRAQTIARTESLRAVRMAEYEALVDINDLGILNPLLRRFWVTCMDERVRRAHIQIPGMNPEGRAMDEPFQTPLGLLRYPCDPNGIAQNVINCRCHLEYRLPNANGEYVGRSSAKLPFGTKNLLGE